MKLWNIRNRKDRQNRYYLFSTICVFALVMTDTLETWTQSNPDLRLLRTGLSIIGYILRPTAALRVAMIIYPGPKNPRYLVIPNILNCLLCMTAFFTPIVFGFDGKYSFVRGPLGFVPFAVSLFYIICSVWITAKYYRKMDHSGKRFLLYLCAFACVIATILDVVMETAFLNSTIMISIVFIYMFLRSYDTSSDPLTKLMNRQSLYEDINRYHSEITAVGSVDMNGLKKLNDTQGHLAGDEALRVIGESLNDCISKSILAYRTGGDEFLVLFILADERTVRETLDQVKEKVSRSGYSVSVGYSMRSDKKDTVDDMIHRSDEKMYTEKAEYYSKNGQNRRRGQKEEG